MARNEYASWFKPRRHLSNSLLKLGTIGRNFLRALLVSSRTLPICPRPDEIIGEDVDAFRGVIACQTILGTPKVPNLQGIWPACLVAVKCIDLRQLEDDQVSATDDPANPLSFPQYVHRVTTLLGWRVLDFYTPRLPEPNGSVPSSHLLNRRQHLHRPSISLRGSCLTVTGRSGWVRAAGMTEAAR